MNIAIIVNVVIPEIPVFSYAEFVVQVASGKIEVKVGLIKVKDPRVVQYVITLLRIFYPDGTMSEGRIKFSLVGATS